MSNPSEVEAQVRFALSQLPVQNAHHEFEHICRRLTEQFICSNVLPATGPVSAGGDQGRDFETFRTYLREELGSRGAFLGLVSEGTIAFICTTQKDGLLAKLRQDIKKVCASGHPVHEIRSFTLEPVSVGIRHQLENEAQESYGVRLEFHDAESIANLLARPEGFWIAERFLSIPSKIRPEAVAANGDLSAEYTDRRRRWHEKGSPNPTLGDFIDLKAGLRETIYHEGARGDFPYWLGLLRQLLAIPELHAHIQQRARYELVAVTVRVTRDLRSVDDVARVYLDESMNESDPARLDDASAILMYANTAVRAGVTSLTQTELADWYEHLTNRIHELVINETSHRRASLLFTLGYLGVHPALTEADIQDLSDEAHEPKHKAEGGTLPNLADISMPEDTELTDASLALSAWTELMDNLEEAPLFPIQTLADILQLLVPLWSNLTEWRKLLDLVDAAVAEREGRHAVAARARDRAIKLFRAERRLDALEEFHQAKIDWWAGDTVRGSLLAMTLIARLYLELWLPHASKSYALAVAYIAATSGDEDLADLIPAGLLMAATADFAAGAWCSATDLYQLGLVAQHELIEDGLDSEKHEEVEDAFLKLAYIKACAGTVDADLAALIGTHEVFEGAIDVLGTKDKDFWESLGDTGLVARPFADLGELRYIRFSALGTDWTLVTTNDIDSGIAAERFASAAQVMLAALAREDMCLLQTQINVRVEYKVGAETPIEERIELLPSNEGREWVVQLGSVRNSNNATSRESDIELLAMLTIILREASLLPDSAFLASLDRAFERGLSHKLSAGRPYDQLLAAFTADTGPEIQGSLYNTPWNCRDGPFRAPDELRWQDGPGPTYSREKANELLQTRYNNLAKSLRITVPMLASSEEFRTIVEELRTRGWLDWHILAAISNSVINYRFQVDRFNQDPEVSQREMLEAAFNSESATAKPVPIGAFGPDSMNENRWLAMLSLLRHWGLECHQKTPDMPAIERLLADRYGYWDEDVPHDDPFPSSRNGESNGGLVVQ